MKTMTQNLTLTGHHSMLERLRLRTLTLALSGLLLSACTTVGPDYEAPPDVDTGSGWSLPLAAETRAADLSRWWRTLDDPVLERLITTALAQNLDLRQAAARVDEARALRDRVAGERLPSASTGASSGRSQQSRNGPLPVDRVPGLNATNTIYDVGFDAAWEADLFGGQRRALQAATARLQATEAEAQGVRLRLVAEVARLWFDAVGTGYELRTHEAVLETMRQTADLVQLQQEHGAASEADVDAALAQWAAADAQLPAMEMRQRAALLGLGVLLGEPPEYGLRHLDEPLAPFVLRALPVGERADVLRRRPDVLAAERQLAASTADIGVATAELFPKLSIGVGGGFQALHTGDWLDSSSTRFSILPLISWRIFDGGRVRAEIRAREAAQQQAALAYEQAVLAALGDAERTLADYHGSLETLERRWAALEPVRRAFDYAQARFAAGALSRMELLAEQRQLYEAETAVVRAHTSAARHLAALYKALGGGWEAPAVLTQAVTLQGSPPAIASAIHVAP